MSKDDLLSLLKWYDCFGGWATFVVIFGVVGEVAVDIYLEWGKKKCWEIAAPALFGFIVGIGIGGEYWASSGVTKYSNELRTRADLEIGSAKARAVRARRSASFARKRAAQALGQAATANERAASANARAAAAELRAEEEQRARLEIEARLAPRVLDPEQQDEVSEFLSRFSGLAIDIVLYVDNEPEPIVFTRQIVHALRGAGWIPNSISLDPAGGRSIVGAYVETEANADDRTRAAALDLVAVLRSTGMDINGPTSPIWRFPTISKEPGVVACGNNDCSPRGSLRLSIGSKRRPELISPSMAGGFCWNVPQWPD